MTDTASSVIQVVRIPVSVSVKPHGTGVAGSTPVTGSEKENTVEDYCDGWCIDCDGGCLTTG